MIQFKLDYFPNVVKNKNILIFGDNELEKFNPIFEKFKTNIFQEVTPFTLENLFGTIMTLDLDMIIVNAKEINSELVEKLDEVKSNKEIWLGICSTTPCLIETKHQSLLNNTDFIFTPKATIEQLTVKIYNLLHTNVEAPLSTNSKEAYKDAFEVDVMILSEELLNLSTAIDEGDISDEVFKKLQKNISKVAQIVDGYMMSSDTIKKFIQLFNRFLETFDKDNITIENIEGFDYLARLVEDIAVFLNKYFVEKKFDDIYVVEDSLKNSFEFMRDKFAGQSPDEDKSNIEFF